MVLPYVEIVSWELCAAPKKRDKKVPFLFLEEQPIILKERRWGNPAGIVPPVRKEKILK